MAISAAFLDARISAIEAQIIAFEAMFLAFATTNIQVYRLDTGQTQQTITRANLTEQRKLLDSLLNKLSTLCALKSGSGTTHGSPLW